MIAPNELLPGLRQLGGLPVGNGRQVRQGLLWRGPALFPLQTPAQREAFGRLGIRLILDFRGEDVRQKLPDPDFPGVDYVGVCASMAAETGAPVQYGVGDMVSGGLPAVQHVMDTVAATYRTMPFGNPAYRLLFDRLQAGQAPLLFHCTSGKDRTGLAALLILMALGASEETAVADYLETNRQPVRACNVLGRHYPAAAASPYAQQIFAAVQNVYPENIRTSIQCILARYGSWDNYFVAEYGLTAARRAVLRAQYTA